MSPALLSPAARHLLAHRQPRRVYHPVSNRNFIAHASSQVIWWLSYREQTALLIASIRGMHSKQINKPIYVLSRHSGWISDWLFGWHFGSLAGTLALWLAVCQSTLYHRLSGRLRLVASRHPPSRQCALWSNTLAIWCHHNDNQRRLRTVILPGHVPSNDARPLDDFDWLGMPRDFRRGWWERLLKRETCKRACGVVREPETFKRPKEDFRQIRKSWF